MSDRYWQRLQQRHPNHGDRPELGWKCLCCRDTGIIPIDSMLRYFEDEETIEMGPCAPGYQCKRRGCQGGFVVQNGQMFPRFAAGSLYESIGAEQCEQLHQWELERLRGAGVDRPDAENARAIAQQVRSIVVEKALNNAVNVVPSPTEAAAKDGLFIGMAAVISWECEQSDVKRELKAEAIRGERLAEGTRVAVVELTWNTYGLTKGMYVLESVVEVNGQRYQEGCRYLKPESVEVAA